jgi:hypothetical protein
LTFDGAVMRIPAKGKETRRVAAFLIKATKGKPVAASFKKAMDKLEREPGQPA